MFFDVWRLYVYKKSMQDIYYSRMLFMVTYL